MEGRRLIRLAMADSGEIPGRPRARVLPAWLRLETDHHQDLVHDPAGPTRQALGTVTHSLPAAVATTPAETQEAPPTPSVGSETEFLVVVAVPVGTTTDVVVPSRRARTP